jgi:hypothetical protein
MQLTCCLLLLCLLLVVVVRHRLAATAKVAVRKLAANDLHLCATFSRRFYWTDLNM